MVGDVCVEFTQLGKPPTRLDLLQKIHHVSPSILIGFAGSVKIGLAMAKNIRDYAAGPGSGYVGTPGRLLHRWQRSALREWNQSTDFEKASGCELLVLGAYPPRGVRCQSSGQRMSAPAFAPQPFVPHQPSSSRHLQAIGSGSQVTSFDDLLKMTSSPRSPRPNRRAERPPRSRAARRSWWSTTTR